jgi:hypothetical protein
MECTVIKTGTTSDGRNWALLSYFVENWEKTIILGCKELPEVGEVVTIPKEVLK